MSLYPHIEVHIIFSGQILSDITWLHTEQLLVPLVIVQCLRVVFHSVSTVHMPMREGHLYTYVQLINKQGRPALLVYFGGGAWLVATFTTRPSWKKFEV